MTPPIHFDLDELEARTRAALASVTAQARGSAKTDADRRLIDVQERAIEVNVALDRFMAAERMNDTPSAMLYAAMSNMIFYFCKSIVNNWHASSETAALMALTNMTMHAMTDGSGCAVETSTVSATVGGNA